MRPTTLLVIGSALALGLVLSLARLLLPACGVSSPLPDWLRFCPAARTAVDPGTLDALEDQRRQLERRIAVLTRQLYDLQCEPAPEQQEAADPVDPERWRARDLGLLDGCWELDSDYATEDRTTGETTSYTEWSVCFTPDGNGAGRQVMRSADGATCTGDVTGSFAANGRLVIAEPGDLPCSDGYTIFRRETTCALTSAGLLDCESVQPEHGGRGDVQMRPADPQ